MNKIKGKRMTLELLERIMDTIEFERKSISTAYEIVGYEDEQMVDRHTGELVFNDDGTPKYKAKWDYVERDQSDLSEDEKAKLELIDKVTAHLEKLI